MPVLKNTSLHIRNCYSKRFFNYKQILRKIPAEEVNMTDVIVIHSTNLLF